MSSTLTSNGSANSTPRSSALGLFAFLVVVTIGAIIVWLVASLQPQLTVAGKQATQEQVQVTVLSAVQRPGVTGTTVSYNVAVPSGASSQRVLSTPFDLHEGDRITVWQRQDTGETSLEGFPINDELILEPTDSAKVASASMYVFCAALIALLAVTTQSHPAGRGHRLTPDSTGNIGRGIRPGLTLSIAAKFQPLSMLSLTDHRRRTRRLIHGGVHCHCNGRQSYKRIHDPAKR